MALSRSDARCLRVFCGFGSRYSVGARQRISEDPELGREEGENKKEQGGCRKECHRRLGGAGGCFLAEKARLVKIHAGGGYEENGNIEPLMNSESLYKCLSCFACVERCPRNVEPAKIVEAVRVAVLRQQGKNHLKPEQIPEMLDPDLPQQAIVTAFRKYAK